MILNEKIIKDELKKVLIEVKDLIEKGEFEFQSTNKNMATFRQLRREHGITYIDFQDEIIDSIKKLDIREVNGKKVVLWSYHFPEHPIKYPFK